MDDPVVVGICKYAPHTTSHFAPPPCTRTACASKRFHAVLRYNQRGVGASSGSKSLTGASDCSDIPHMLSFLLQQMTNTTPPTATGQPPDARVWVVGYSWGSCLAAHALECPWVCGFVAISPPLGTGAMVWLHVLFFPISSSTSFAAQLLCVTSFHTGGGFSPLGLGTRLVLQPLSHLEALACARVPCLLVSGTRDQFTPVEVFAEQAARLLGARAETPEQAPDSALDVQVVFTGLRGTALLVGAGDHFFGGMWGPLCAAVLQWVHAHC